MTSQVPEGWANASLGELANLYQPVTIPASMFTSLGYPVYGANGVVGLYDRYNHEKWQILITCRGSTCGTVNKTSNKVWITGNAMVINVDSSNLLDKEFAYHLISSQNYSDCITGTGQPQIVRDPLEKFRVSYPVSLAEQKAIAKALSDIDELIESIKKELHKKKNFKVALTQKFLSEAVGSNIKLGDYAEFSKGNSLPKSALSETGTRKAIHYGELFTHYPENIKQIKSRTNLNNLSVVFSKANDVLMPTSDVTPNGLATASCINEEGVVLGGDILIVRTDPNLIDGTYLSYVIRNSKEKILKLVNGTTVYHLYGKDLGNFEFILPSIIYQRESVEALEILGEEISLIETELAKYECIKQGMAHDLLTGKVRLV